MNIILDDADQILPRVDFRPFSQKSILVTGASGLVGSYITATLHQLVKSQNFKIKYLALMQKDPPENLQEIFDFPGIEIIKGDLTDANFLQSLPPADFIIHAAGYGQPGKFIEDSIKTLKLNTLSTFKLFEKLKPGGKFLFISSSEVYNGLDKPPFKESQIGTTNTNNPRSCYIEGKRTGEAICAAYRQKGTDAKSARLSLAYGPGTRVDDQRVVNSFIQQALSSKQIKLLDQGLVNRTYCYITDAIEILFQILFHGKDDIYNVGGKSRITIAQLAQMIAKITKVAVIFPAKEKGLQGAPSDVYLDMSKVESEFGKVEFVPLLQGLKRTIEYQKKLYL